MCLKGYDYLKIMIRCLAFLFFISLGFNTSAGTLPEGDRICGKWISTDKNLIVQVYKENDRFRAKIVWFRDDPSKPMDEWCDAKNPDPALRSRRILGMDVLSGLKYDEKNHSWGDGMIYDAQHGKQWDAFGYIDKDGLLKVKGYWHFKIFGRTMTFKRA
jgi:uncharacterized protein (DUF2147 family)